MVKFAVSPNKILRGLICPYCNEEAIAREGSIYVCSVCSSEVNVKKKHIQKIKLKLCPTCGSSQIRKARLSNNNHNEYFCKNCNKIWDFEKAQKNDIANEEENFGYENKCPACDSINYEKKGFRNEKQRYVCKDCGRNWTSSGVVKNLVFKQPKTKDIFQRENTLEKIVAYLKNQETNNMPLKFWYRDDTKPREMNDYFIDEKYVQVRSDKGYFIKFLINRIRKI